MRKSPYRHKVHTYKRRTGRVVNQYLRGQGDKLAEHHRLANPRMKHAEACSSQYIVHVTYVELPKETYPVTAQSYPEAIDKALSQRTHIDVPWHIRVVRS